MLVRVCPNVCWELLQNLIRKQCAEWFWVLQVSACCLHTLVIFTLCLCPKFFSCFLSRPLWSPLKSQNCQVSFFVWSFHLGFYVAFKSSVLLVVFSAFNWLWLHSQSDALWSDCEPQFDSLGRVFRIQKFRCIMMDACLLDSLLLIVSISSAIGKVHISQAVGCGRFRWHVHPGVQLQHNGQSEAVWGSHRLYPLCISSPYTSICAFLIRWHAYKALGLGQRLDLHSNLWRALPLCYASDFQPKG